MDDKVKVDEPLISTDVDMLIRTISEKKKASLWDLQRTCGINRRALDKWVRVLEDEGYIRIEYGITGTYVRWAGPSEEEVVKEVQKKTIPEEKKGEYKTNVEEERAQISEPSFDDEEQTPEELLQKYVTLKKREEDKEHNELKSNILKNFDDEDDYSVPEEIKEEETDDLEFPVKDEEPELGEAEPELAESGETELTEIEETEPDVNIAENKDDDEFFRFKDEQDSEEVPDVTEISEPEEPKDEPEEVDDEPLRFPDDEPGEKFGKEVPKSIYDGEVRDLLNAYVHEINEEKAGLHKLEKEKDELYRNKMLSLENKMETDMASLTNYVLEHESRLLEMKEGVLELPDKVEEITRMQTEIRNLNKEGKRSLRETKEKVDTLISVMKKTEKDLKGRINDARASMEREETKIEDLDRIRESIEAKSEKILTALDVMQNKVSDINEKMEGLTSELQQAGEMKSEIENSIDAIKNDIDSRGSDLDGLEEDLKDVVKLEGWARQYINDYEDKIDQIDSYVRKSSQELASVKEAAEASYLKKYLGELENITSTYENALNRAVVDEKHIDEKITEKKNKIRALVKESQEMIKRIRTETADSAEYEEIKKKAERRTAKAKRIIEEKAQEGEKLHEEVKKKKSRRKSRKKK